MESLSRRLRVDPYWCVTFFLLFVLPGAFSLTVAGQIGSNITLPCNSGSTQKLSIVLTFGPKTAYGRGQDEHFRGRVHKSGSCDLILQDLKTTDAGKYTADVHDNSGLISRNSFDVHVKVSLTGQKGEELMFDLPREAESVEHLTNTGRTEVWRRERGVLTDRLTDNNGRLTIENFTSSDEGSYRVLTSSGEDLVTVTVTEPSTGSKDKQDGTHEDETHDREGVPVGVWIGIGVVVALVVLIVFAVIMKRRCRNENEEHDSYQEVPMQEPVHGPR